MTAAQRKMDIFGVTVLGVINALGGGIIRDVLLGQTPPRAFYGYEYVLTTAALSVLVFFSVFRLKEENGPGKFRILNSLINIFDAIGLGAFTITGIQSSIMSGFADNAFLTVSLGVITGVGGGVLRDVMSGQTPAVLTKHIYAVAAILGGCAYYFMYAYGFDRGVCWVCGMVLTVTMRVLSAHFKWSLPRIGN